MRKPRSVPFVAGLSFWILPALGAAQTSPQAKPQFQSGQFGFSPAVVMSAGYDSNLARSEDVTSKGAEYFVIPQGRLFFRPGRALFTGAFAAEYVKAADVDANSALTGAPKANTLGEGTFDFAGTRLTFSGLASLKQTNARPTGFEVGARSVRVEQLLQAVVGVNLSGRTRLNASYSRIRTTWDADQIYEGSVLATNLNSLFTTIGSSFGYSVTPITSVFAQAELRDQLYYLAPQRDNRSRVLGAGIGFAPQGLLSGLFSIGWNSMRFPAEDGSDTSGLVIAGNLHYSRPSGSFVSVRLTRDKQPSYDVNQGQVRVAGASVLANAPLFRRASVFASASYYRLSYVAPVERLETHQEVGGGLWWPFRTRSRVGVRAEYYRHDDPSGLGQKYQGFAVISYFIYGLNLVRPIDRPIPQ